MNIKRARVTFPILIALLIPSLGRAQTTLYPVAEAVVRDGSNANLDLNESSLGYLMVKYSTAGSSGKAYFKFDFAGQAPNTNATLTLGFTTFNNSQRQHLQVWALNQAYSGFTGSSLVWNTAQANDTSSNSLLTNSATTGFTATPLVDFISPGGAGAQASAIVPAPWGRYLINDQLILVLTSPFNDPTNQANGLRVQTNTAYLTFSTVAGSPPTISPITNVTLVAGQVSSVIPFTVGDAEDGPGPLSLGFSSSNENIVPSGSVVFGGSGADRHLTLTAGDAPGTATAYVSVTDTAGNTSQSAFTVMVLPQNYTPLIDSPGTTFTPLNTPVTVNFAVSDAETSASDLVVSGEIASYSSGVLASLEFGGSGSNRSVKITPVPGADGAGVVTLFVADPQENTNSVPFAVMVLPTGQVIFSEHFDYPDGQLFPLSANLWTRRNSQAQSLRLNVSGQQGYIRPKSSADDGAAPLAGAPYVPGSHALIYTMFTATWLELPDVIPPVTNSVGSFVQLLNAATATSAALAEVVTSTNNAPEGLFELGLSDASGLVQSLSAPRLAVPSAGTMTTAKVVTRYDVDAGWSSLWVDAASEVTPAATSRDSLTPTPISYVGLRQDLGMGYIYIDDLKVVLAYRPVITAGLLAANTEFELAFSGGAEDSASAFRIQRAADLNSPFTDTSATIVALGNGNFKATVPGGGSQAFFRIRRLPMSF